jgi:hypothetical protein
MDFGRESVYSAVDSGRNEGAVKRRFARNRRRDGRRCPRNGACPASLSHRRRFAFHVLRPTRSCFTTDGTEVHEWHEEANFTKTAVFLLSSCHSPFRAIRVPSVFAVLKPVCSVEYIMFQPVHRSFPRKRESTFCAGFWIPAFAGMTLTQPQKVMQLCFQQSNHES